MSLDHDEDVPIKFTAFERADTTHGVVVSTTWKAFCGEISQGFPVRVEDKKAGPSVVLGTFVDTSENARKDEKNFDYSTMAGLDFDDITWDDLADVLCQLDDHKYAALVYTTYSHARVYREKGKYRVRLIVPLSRKVYKQEWEDFYGGLLDMFPAAQTDCGDPTRAWFMPVVPYGVSVDEDNLICTVLPGKAVVPEDIALTRWQDRVQNKGAFRKGGERVSEKELKRFQKKLQRRNPETASMLEQVLLGEPFAEKGERDNSLYRLCQDLAKGFPRGDAGGIAQRFKASLSSMVTKHTVESVQQKLERAQEDAHAEELALAEAEAKRFRELKKTTGVPSDYTKQYVMEWGLSVGCPVEFEDFKQRLVVHHRNDYYLFFNGDYILVSRDGLHVACRDLLLPAKNSLDVDIHKVTENGKKVLKTPSELFAEYGTEAPDVHIVLGAKNSYYDPRIRTFVIAKCPLRPLQPTFSEGVDRWMRAACPDDASLEHFRDWMAVAPDLSRPLVMLALIGETSVGKSSFAEGMSRLWATSTVSMEVMFDNFQDSVWECPLLLADEDFPKDSKNRVPSARLRTILTSGEHLINKKHVSAAKTKGYFRLVAALQNVEKLRALSHQNGKEDVEAVMARILVIHCRTEASKLFDWEAFVNNEEIAKHSLWLKEQRLRTIVEAGSRFGIRSRVADPQSEVFLYDKSVLAVMECVSRWLVDRSEEDSSCTPAIVVKGNVHVHPRKLLQVWDQLFDRHDSAKPTYMNFYDAVRSVSRGDLRVRLPSRKYYHYLTIDSEALLAFVRDKYKGMNLQRELQLYSHELFEDGSEYRFDGDKYPDVYEVAARNRILAADEADVPQAAD